MNAFQDLVVQYGYYAVFLFLSLGIFGLPLPDEVVIAFTGYLSSLGVFSFANSLVITIAGVFIGTLMTYMLGKQIGRPTVLRYGKWVGLTKKRVTVIENWFGRYGPWTVTIGFLVPGMRHFVCCFSGMTNMCVRRYLVFSSIGITISAIIFVSLGYIFKWPFS